MKCKQIHSLIYDYEDGTADERTRSAIEAHLSGCAACRLQYQTQRRLHEQVASAVSSELAGIHLKSLRILDERAAERRALTSVWVRRMAFAASCLIVLGATTWVFWKPVPKPPVDLASSAYAEAYHYLDMCPAGSPGSSSDTTPLAVIIQPGVPTRIIALDGTTNVSDALK